MINLFIGALFAYIGCQVHINTILKLRTPRQPRGLLHKYAIRNELDFVSEANKQAVLEEEIELSVISYDEERYLSQATRLGFTDPEVNGQDTHLDAIQNNGVVRIDKVLTQGRASQIVNFVNEDLSDSIAAVEGHRIQALSRFSNMLASGNRWDFKLQIDHPVILGAMKEIFRGDKAVGQLLSSLVTEGAELFEMAAFCTLPGAMRQVVHADTLWSKRPALYTCAIALQDVSDEMGPTLFIPGTHTKAAQKKFDSAKTKAEFLSSTPNVLSNLKLGDVSIYDSRVLHCGTSNRSEKQRILLYATFRNPGGPSSNSDFWNVASIRPEYKGKYFLGDFMSS